MQQNSDDVVNSVKAKMFSGALWMVLFKFTNRIIGLVSTMILARILVPEDYGLVAMAMSAYAFLEIMAAFGFDVVLIQNEDATDEDFNSAWTVRLICFSLLSGLLFLSAPIAAAFYGEPRLELIVAILAAVMFTSGLENIAVIKFRKELHFKKEFYYQLWIKVAGFVVTLPCAVILKDYWALVIGIVVSKLAALVLGYLMIPHMPKFTLKKAGYIFNYSKWLLLSNLLRFLELRLPDFVLGKVYGSRAVGIFSMANELAQTTSAEIIAPLNRAVFPGYSKLKSDHTELAKNYLSIVSLIALFILPLGIGIALTSEYLVGILLGDKWGEVIIPLSILAIGYGVSGVMSNTQYIYYVLGLPKVVTLFIGVKVAILVPGIIYSAKHHGIVGVAFVYMFVNLLIPFVHMVLVRGMLGIRLRQFFLALYRPALSSLLMFFAINSLSDVIRELSMGWDLLGLFFTAAVGAFVYGVSILMLWSAVGKPESAEKQALDKISDQIKARLKAN